MSATPPPEYKLTPCRVKAKEREDVNIDRLVKHGAARLSVPAPVYADLTDLPQSRGEAARRLVTVLQGIDPALSASILRLPTAQAVEVLNKMTPPAPKRDDKQRENEQGGPKNPQSQAAPQPAPSAGQPKEDA